MSKKSLLPELKPDKRMLDSFAFPPEPEVIGGGKENKTEFETDLPKRGTSPNGTQTVYKPASERGTGKAAYGLNFESSKNTDDLINTNSPFASYRITSKTGSRDTGIKGASKNHAGLDRAVPAGTAISLPMGTTFHASGYDKARGNWIEVKDANGYILHYQHLQDVGSFKPGQAISAGTTIARSGSSGVGKAHLHEEYYSPDGKNVTESYWASHAKTDGKIMPLSNVDVGSGTYIQLNENGMPKFATGDEAKELLIKAAEERQSALKKRFEDAGLKPGEFKSSYESIEGDKQINRVTGEAIESAISGIANAYAGFGSMINDAFKPVAKNVTDLAQKSSFAGLILNPNAEVMNSLYDKLAEKVNKWDMTEKEELDKAIGEIDGEVGQGVARLYSDVIRTGVEMVPTVIVGLSGGGAVAGGEKAVGFVNKALKWGKGLMKNPAFWDTYVRETGSTYQEAVKDGASQGEAFAAANITGFLNAAVEHSGGVEKELPKLAGSDKFIKKLVKAWGKNAFEEGLEEGVQDNITSIVKKFTYKKESEWFSFADNDAVFNPIRTGKSMAMGYLIGGILGTGGATVSSVSTAFKNAVAPERKVIKEKVSHLEERLKNGDFKGMTPEEINADAEVQELIGIIRKNSVEDESGRFSVGEEHTPEMKKIIREYTDSVDSELVGFIQHALDDTADNSTVYKIAKVNERNAVDVEKETGIDVRGYTHSIKTNDIRHISKRHGVDGIHDRSMRDIKDIARIGYVLENYDEVFKLNDTSAEYRDKQQRPAPTIKYRKRINGTYYVVEAVPDTKKRELKVIAAYIKPAEQQTEDVQAPPSNVRNASADAGDLTVKFPVTGSKAEGITPNKVDDGDVSSASFEEGLARKHQLSVSILSENDKNVKRKYHPLNRTQRRFFSSFGVDVVVLPDLPEGANAKILTKSGMLLVSPYAKVTGWELARHEFTHYIKTFYPKAYKGYVDAVKLELGDKWQAEYDRVYKKYEAFAERYPDEGITLDEDVITEELVAEYAEGFENSDFMKRTAERDLSVAASIRNTLKNLIQRIKAIFTPAELRANRESIEYIMTAKDMWEKAVIEAAKSPRTVWKNVVREKMYSIGSVLGKNGILKPSYTAKELSSNAIKVLDMESVKDLTGEEFGQSDVPLADRVLDFFKSLNNEVISEELGRVALSKTSFKDDINHGLTEKKVQAFAAIPEVIKSGKVIFINSKGSERVVVAAPITIAGEKYYMGVMLKRSAESQRLYIHDIITEKEATVSDKTGAGTPEHNRDLHRDTENLFLTSILQRALSVKGKFSYTPPSDTDTESEPYAFGYNIDEETKSEESGHDWDNDMWGDGSIVRDMEGTRKDRQKQSKKDGKNIFQFYWSEIRILENIINDLQRAAAGKEPRHYALLKDLRQTQYELTQAEKENDTLKAQKLALEAKLKVYRQLFGSITSEHLSSLPVRATAEKFKKLTKAHMTTKAIATKLQNAYSVILAGSFQEETGGVDGYSMILDLVREMFESRKMSGDYNAANDRRINYIANEMVRVLFEYKASAEGKQNVMEAFAKLYKEKYVQVLGQKNAHIEYPEDMLKTTPDERSREAVKELIERHKKKEFEQDDEDIYEEEEMHNLYGVVKNIIDRGVSIVKKRPKAGMGYEVPKIYLKFDHATTKQLDNDAEYKEIIGKIRYKVNRNNVLDDLDTEEVYSHHSLFKYMRNDVWRSFRMFFGKNYKAMKRLILDPFEDAKLHKEYLETFYLNMLEEKIVKELGIEAGSDLSAAVQYYGEYVKPGKERKAHGVKASKAKEIYDSLSDADKEKVQEAEMWFRWMYDGLLESVNYARRTIYPHAEEIIREKEAERQELTQYLKFMEIALADGDLSNFKDYNYRSKKLDSILKRQESAEALLHRSMNIATDSIHKLTERIEAVEAEMEKCKRDDTKRYFILRERLAELTNKRDEFEALEKVKETELLERISNLKNEYKEYGGKFVDKVYKDIARMQRRLSELELELDADNVAYGRQVEARENYFHHMAEEAGVFAQAHGFLNTLANNGADRGNVTAFNEADKDGAIALELAGKSAGTKPKARFQGAFMRRKDHIAEIDFDAVGGFLHYLPQAAYASTIDPQIAIFRKLADDLRDKHSAGEDNRSNAVANFVMYLDRFANDLAGKTNECFDRFIMDAVGRDKFMSVTRAAGYIKKTQILYNVSSMIAQSLNIPYALGYIGSPKCAITGIHSALKAWSDNDSDIAFMMRQSQFLNERFSDNYMRKGFVKAKSGTGRNVKYSSAWLADKMLSVFDEAATKYIWCTAYNKAKAENVDPVRYADDVTRRTVAGRGIGEMSYLQRSKVVGMFMPFTVESGNAFRIFADVARDAKEKGGKKAFAFAVWQLMGMFAMSALANLIIEFLRGSDGGLIDPIGTVADGVKTNKTWYQIAGMLAGDVIGSAPAGSMMMSLYPEYGSGALPSRAEIFGDRDPARYGNDSMFASPAKFIGKGIEYAINKDAVGAVGELAALLPGGSQMRKTIKGVGALGRGNVRKSNGDIKYEVERTPGNIVKGTLFGENAFREAKEYNNPVLAYVDTKGTDGFNYQKKSRKVTVGEGVLAKEIELSGDELQAFESDRFTEYKRLYTDITSGEYKLQNPYNRLTEAKKYTQANKDFKARLKELYEQGSIDRAQYTQYYTDYKIGNEVSLNGLEFAVRAKETVCKKYSELTPAQKKVYQNNLRNLYKKGELTKEKYDNFIQYLMADGEVYVKEFITGDFDSLNEEQKKLVVSKMNSMATEYAKGKMK